ncbi:isoprenylcysteine carboxylmethyltransferase family protein [Variovorax sp. J22P271]|uniref:methyltransferase family protein n=1 Tax=Variovorax davisae TaxID=3053515 RepID=UPI00257909E0|nr:isoprenylcysteine carboxylmethyltransferase family protein [Variovorax sp. J22P271]MDM0035864.1 isoprenylcysteine carboxylmethyltransferase family protein [Variovorax sp. J22P271]
MLLPLAAYGPTFVVVSSVLLYISRGAMTRPRSHGFYRFFAWECILGLIWINLPVWGADPLALPQRVAMVLFMASVWLPVHAFRLLRRHGHPGEARQDEALIGFEKTTALVTAGAFRYIRHPMYTSLICLAWGIFLQQFTWLGLALVMAATLLLFVTALREEQECLAHFGQAYRDYMRRTRRFLPFLL